MVTAWPEFNDYVEKFVMSTSPSYMSNKLMLTAASTSTNFKRVLIDAAGSTVSTHPNQIGPYCYWHAPRGGGGGVLLMLALESKGKHC